MPNWDSGKVRMCVCEPGYTEQAAPRDMPQGQRRHGRAQQPGPGAQGPDAGRVVRAPETGELSTTAARRRRQKLATRPSPKSPTSRSRSPSLHGLKRHEEAVALHRNAVTPERPAPWPSGLIVHLARAPLDWHHLDLTNAWKSHGGATPFYARPASRLATCPQ